MSTTACEQSFCIQRFSDFLQAQALVLQCLGLVNFQRPEEVDEWLLNCHIASLAQEKRRLISERTKAALAERRKQGKQLRKAGREAHSQKAQQATQAALSRAKALQDQGLSLKKIAETLNAEGLLTSRGTNWSKQAITKRLT